MAIRLQKRISSNVKEMFRLIVYNLFRSTRRPWTTTILLDLLESSRVRSQTTNLGNVEFDLQYWIWNLLMPRQNAETNLLVIAYQQVPSIEEKPNLIPLPIKIHPNLHPLPLPPRPIINQSLPPRPQPPPLLTRRNPFLALHLQPLVRAQTHRPRFIRKTQQHRHQQRTSYQGISSEKLPTNRNTEFACVQGLLWGDWADDYEGGVCDTGDHCEGYGAVWAV